MNALRFLALAFLMLFAVVSCTREPVEEKVSFARHVKPLLQDRCVGCHNSGALFGNLNLENRAYAFRKRPEGAAILPQHAAQSPLYLVLTLTEGERKAMPPSGHRISPEEVDLIKRWIDQGAEWPEGVEGVVKPHTGSAGDGT